MNTPGDRPTLRRKPARATDATGDVGTPPSGGPGQPRRVDSRALFEGESVVLIVHGAETYRLQATRLGKLILTT
jgi:hemin uptake protein HemP